MKYRLFNTGLCRTSAFSSQQSLQEIWAELKLKIAESSPVFFDCIREVKAREIALLPQKVQYTIWKYYNRARYRTTPFGSFAAVSTFEFTEWDTEAALINPEMTFHHFLDWAQKDHLSMPSNLHKNMLLLSNASYYLLADEVRFLKYNGHKFELLTLPLFPELQFILTHCRVHLRVNELCAHMNRQFGITNRQTCQLIKQLTDLQLLFTDRQANITGDDYFKRLCIPTEPDPGNYIIAQRQAFKIPHIPKLNVSFNPFLEWLTQVYKPSISVDLDRFKSAFRQKYEGNTISLAQALDPETGIGYGDFAQLNEESLLAAMKITNHTRVASHAPENVELHAYITSHIGKKQTIALENFRVQRAAQPTSFANTFSALIRHHGEQVVIDNLGGCTATSLLGRFTVADPAIEIMGKELVQFEEAANPDVIFFDVAYQAEGHVDNVNRRKHLYAKELPLLSYSTHQSPLSLSDILVKVSGNEVLLCCAKTGKRLVPRIPSAYNYRRSDLPLYRFLCDLQHQGIFSSIDFNLVQQFPGFDYYPSMCFNNLVLWPETWKFPLSLLKEPDLMLQEERVSAWIRANVQQRVFKTSNGDQALYVDPNNPADRLAFMYFLRTYKGAELYLYDALLNESDGIKDGVGNGYRAQYLLHFGHLQNLYPPITQHQQAHVLKNEDLKLPGEEWLYFEIYCHPYRANSVLQLLNTYLKTISERLKKWFFIRYSLPEPHIRLRIKLTDPEQLITVLASMQELIKPLLVRGQVSDYGVKTYFRETTRYQGAPYDLVERFFAADSTYLISLISKLKSDEQAYTHALYLIGHLLPIYSDDDADQLQFVRAMAKRFAAEIQIDTSHFKQINMTYPLVRKQLDPIGSRRTPKKMLRIIKLFKEIMAHCLAKPIRQAMFADLIHLHINRVFSHDQRIHETIIYQLLWTNLRAKQALLKQQVE